MIRFCCPPTVRALTQLGTYSSGDRPCQTVPCAVPRAPAHRHAAQPSEETPQFKIRRILGPMAVVPNDRRKNKVATDILDKITDAGRTFLDFLQNARPRNDGARGYARVPEHGYEPRNTGRVETVSESTVKRRSPRANAPRHLSLCCDEPSWSGL